MSFSSYALLVLALAVSACASSSGTSFGEGGQTATRAARGNSTLIVRAELVEFQGRTALVAVEDLRRRWLQPRRSPTFNNPGSFYARVVVDGIVRGELRELSIMGSENIESMRYLSPADATTRYGTGFMGGVIEVTTLTAR